MQWKFLHKIFITNWQASSTAPDIVPGEGSVGGCLSALILIQRKYLSLIMKASAIINFGYKIYVKLLPEVKVND